jgi:chorismate mutase
MSTDTQNESFDDLEEMDHSDIKEMRGDLERDLRSVERQHRELREERRDQIDLVRSLRSAVGEMKSADGARKGLLREFHSIRKSAEKARQKRDSVNTCIPPPSDVLAEWLDETHRRLVTIDNDLTAVPTLARELDSFGRFFELQAAIVRKSESEEAHSEYVGHVKKMREVTAKLDAARKSRKEKVDGALDETELDSDKISRSDIRKTSRRIDKIDKNLDGLSSERKGMRRRLGRIKAYQKITLRGGRAIRLADVKDRAQSGGSLDTSELEALLNSGGLSEITETGSPDNRPKPKAKQSRKKRGMKLGVTRGGSRRGTMAARREGDE